ncbi:hypothetical protein [Streptomyces sp. NPDC003032]
MDTEPYWALPEDVESADDAREQPAQPLLLGIAAFALSLLALFDIVAQGVSDRDAELNRRLAALKEQSTTISATVRHETFAHIMGRHRTSGELFTFRFTGPSGTRRTVEVEFADNNYFGREKHLFSPGRLRDLVVLR